MSRPNTRNKNKRQRPADLVDPSSQILRKIHKVNDVTDDDINQLFMLWKPVCQGCRVNTRDNPNCFCGLVPPINGSRKTGLWQKMSEIVQAFGQDPAMDSRASDSTPAGLTNLGATCYANSILQCLYMNTAFRERVFSVEVDILKQFPVLDQITRLFAQLHASKMSFVDSAAFVKTLELDNGIQQDTHEFLTLLLSLLERCLRHSGVRNAKTIVQDLFRGSVSHVTTCSKCGRDSEASSKVEDFYALELNIKGLKTLDASLNDYLNLEHLTGDNQYFCGCCNARVDATRCIKLRTLPPVITFQLKRCVFLPKTTAKKKITSSFSFPEVLDMSLRLAESSQNDLTYDLSAVLIHKGSAVNSGHYVAHIKDEKTGLWWEFDDERVSELGQRPFKEASSTTHSESNGMASSENTIDLTKSGSSSCSSAIKSEIFSSSDAYMLMYSLRCDKQQNQEEQKEIPADVTNGEDNSVQQLEGGYLPLHLNEWINNMNAAYLESCEQFRLRKEREMNSLTERRQEVRAILSEAPVQSLEELFFWISTDWLRLWADTVMPPALDNTPLLCSHEKVLASKVNCMKRISALAWAKLESKFNGGPKLGKGDYCRDCLMDGARMVVFADSYRDRRTFMKTIASDVLLGKCEDGKYYISKVWLQQWMKRKNLDAPTEADAGPTNAITCNHGQLMPEQAPGARRILVPENLWSFLSEDASKLIPEDTLGSPCFPLDSSQCSHCTEELSEVACLEDSIRTLKAKQRQNHEKLAAGKGIPLTPQSQYFLLSSSWLVQWRIYINMTGKNSSSVPEPELLDGVIDTLKCKHARLLERLPELVCKRGSFFQKSPSTDKLTIIPEQDWRYFCEEWGGIVDNGISAVIEVGNNIDQSLPQDVSVPEKQQLSSPDDNIETDAQQLTLKTIPEICEECIGDRESCELMKKLSYSEGDVFVCLVRGKEAPKTMLEASDSSFEVDRRTSKRSRRTNYGNLQTLKVSASTTVYQLKMMIWELLGVMKENQELHKGAKVIDEESATLADMNIFPGDKLWVRDTEMHEHRDIADELCDKKMEARDVEEGFRGTLLTADISSEAC